MARTGFTASTLQFCRILSIIFVIQGAAIVTARTLPPFRGDGTAKNAWPEFVGQSSGKVVDQLKASGLVKNVYVQPPVYGEDQRPPSNRGGPDDVWIYTDQNDQVYEIPRRGIWHPNRVSPGWPELVGQEYQAAIATILKDFFGVTVRYVPDGYLNTVKLAFRSDRVFVNVDNHRKVAKTPYVF